jgi:hypothetical protein
MQPRKSSIFFANLKILEGPDTLRIAVWAFSELKQLFQEKDARRISDTGRNDTAYVEAKRTTPPWGLQSADEVLQPSR